MEALCLQIIGTEVSRMKQDPIWQAFAETGDPLYYLLYRAAQRADRAEPGREQTSSRTAAVNT